MADQGGGIEVLLPRPEHGQRRHDDLHPGADRAQRAGAVIDAGGVGIGSGGQQQVGEDVGAQLGGAACVRARLGSLVARVDDRLGLLGEAVEDAHGEDRRQRRDQVGHAVLPGHDAHAPCIASALVPFGQGGRLQTFGEGGEARPQSPGTEPVGGRDGEQVEFRARASEGRGDPTSTIACTWARVITPDSHAARVCG